MHAALINAAPSNKTSSVFILFRNYLLYKMFRLIFINEPLFQGLMAYDDIIQEGDLFIYSFKAPKDRVAVFIGEKGATKRQLTDDLDVRLDIDGREGDITAKSHDSLKLYIAKGVLKAIARGFNPELATLLLRPDYAFELIDMTDFATTKDALTRLKGRVIGLKGKSWHTIEDLTECNMVVYGKTVAIIGQLDHMPIARKAVEALLSGSQHSAVYKWLEKQRRSFKAQF